MYNCCIWQITVYFSPVYGIIKNNGLKQLISGGTGTNLTVSKGMVISMRIVTNKKETETYTLDTKNEIYKYQGKGIYQADMPIYIDLAGITKPYENYYFSRRETSRMAKDIYVIEYIRSGAGYIGLRDRGQGQRVGSGDLYIINRGYAVTYYADPADPFEKLWFNLGGRCVKNLLDTFSINTPVYICHMSNKEIEKAFSDTLDMLDSDTPLQEKNYRMIEFLTRLFIEIDRISEKPEEAGDIFESISAFIDANIYKNLGINDIADYFFISRCSLYRIFMRNAGVPPKQYQLEKKIEKAKALLISENLSTEKVAEMLGFCDKYHFCRIFKQVAGKSPSEYRAQNAYKKPPAPAAQ